LKFQISVTLDSNGFGNLRVKSNMKKANENKQTTCFIDTILFFFFKLNEVFMDENILRFVFWVKYLLF